MRPRDDPSPPAAAGVVQIPGTRPASALLRRGKQSGSLLQPLRADFLGGILDDFPDVAQVLLGGEDVAQTDAHHGAAAQFRLRKISAPGSIDLLHNLAVGHIDLLIVAGGCETKTDNAHHNRRGQFETPVLLTPIGNEFGQAQVLANTP